MNILELKNIKKKFDDLEVLKDISIGVEEGKIFSIIGPSGSGKSTLLRCATLLETIDDGEISYLGEKNVYKDAVVVFYMSILRFYEGGIRAYKLCKAHHVVFCGARLKQGITPAVQLFRGSFYQYFIIGPWHKKVHVVIPGDKSFVAYGSKRSPESGDERQTMLIADSFKSMV